MAESATFTQKNSAHEEESQRSNQIKTGPDSQENAKPVQKTEVAAREEPSGYRGENPATAGLGNTGVKSGTPENAEKHLNPSAPGDTGTTPGSTPEE